MKSYCAVIQIKVTDSPTYFSVNPTVKIHMKAFEQCYLFWC